MSTVISKGLAVSAALMPSCIVSRLIMNSTIFIFVALMSWKLNRWRVFGYYQWLTSTSIPVSRNLLSRSPERRIYQHIFSQNYKKIKPWTTFAKKIIILINNVFFFTFISFFIRIDNLWYWFMYSTICLMNCYFDYNLIS